MGHRMRAASEDIMNIETTKRIRRWAAIYARDAFLILATWAIIEYIRLLMRS